jgi:hypothetical protein
MRSVSEGRARALRIRGAGQVSTETDAVACYRRQVKANEINRRPIAGRRREDSAREEEEMAKR